MVWFSFEGNICLASNVDFMLLMIQFYKGLPYVTQHDKTKHWV